jgi:hypothetical protein
MRWAEAHAMALEIGSSREVKMDPGFRRDDGREQRAIHVIPAKAGIHLLLAPDTVSNEHAASLIQYATVTTAIRP